MDLDTDAGVYDALLQHPHVAELAGITRTLMDQAVEAQRFEATPDRVSSLAADRDLDSEGATTSAGNAVEILARSPKTEAERALLRALTAHAVRIQPPANREEEDRLAGHLLWLAAHTPFDATSLLDSALGDDAANLWDAIADRIRLVDRGQSKDLGRGEALLGAVAVSASRSKSALRQTHALAVEITDRKLYRVLAARGADFGSVLCGEMAPAPRRPIATTLLGLSGILFFCQAARAFATLLLAYRRPAEVQLSDQGALRIHYKTELLGRILRDRDVTIPAGALALARREVRYSGIALYAGLFALAVGSYVGISAFVDGIRAASPSLLLTGLGIVALGLALDFVLSSVVPAAKGECRVLFVARTGQRICVGHLDKQQADAMLSRLAQRPAKTDG